eukprot:Anaeramoba_ignava/a3899_16.p1 GENE.a3899_16~~a3899_16.p1  ORF type:complete len:260 (-),score=53.16 a3899_16:146-925(-)
MFKKVSLLLLVFVFSLTLEANKISKEECTKDNFIFAGGECIEYRAYKGESNDRIVVIVHGTWDEGTNTLGRYAPFAETMNMNTDLTTIAVALPGYSGSSTNNFTSLAHKGVKNLAAKKDYVLFLGKLIKALKEKYNAEEVTYIGHSAGAMMGATLMGLNPDLVQNIALAGGRYDIHKDEKGDLISLVDVIDDVNKEARFLFIYGTKDEISKPEVTTSFYKIAQEKGLNAKLVKVEGAGHIDLDMTDASIEAITEMLEEE